MFHALSRTCARHSTAAATATNTRYTAANIAPRSLLRHPSTPIMPASSTPSTAAATPGHGTTACSTTTTRYVVAVDGMAAPSDLTSKEFLTSRPSGAYTTARTCAGGTRLFEWSTHLARTASSVTAMMTAHGGKVKESLVDLTTADTLRPRIEATVAPAMREYTRAHGAGTELKATLLVNWEGDTGSVACHIQPLPPLPTAPVRVEVRGAPRANALAKDSSWVSERAPLEALLRGDMHELILATETGALMEGSQTNFYAIQDGAVHTAGDGILEGTVRRLLLEVCAREGVPVVLQPPQLGESCVVATWGRTVPANVLCGVKYIDLVSLTSFVGCWWKLAAASTWEGALISSTSRLLLPIDELFVPQEGKCSEATDMQHPFDNGPASLAARLRDLVQGEVEAHSSHIL